MPNAVEETSCLSTLGSREALPLPVTGLILCGGRSRRMGRNKAFLPFGGKTLIEHLLTGISGIFDELFLIANEPESFSQLNVEVLKDILPYRGPLGGILSGLLVAKNPYVFVMACDMPLIHNKLLREMCGQRHDHDVVVLAHDGEVEPLIGLYSKDCVKPLEEALFAQRLKVQDFLLGLKAKTYNYQPDLLKGGQLPPYFNVNTPQEYSELLTCSL